MSLLSRLTDNLGRDQAELESDDLAAECARPGCVPIGSLSSGADVRVTGVVHSLAVQPPDVAPRLEVELYDGTGRLCLIWHGRRRIPGIRTGAYLTVSGRVTDCGGRLTLFNPGYDLLPGRG